jgi:hypothetical protein
VNRVSRYAPRRNRTYNLVIKSPISGTLPARLYPYRLAPASVEYPRSASEGASSGPTYGPAPTEGAEPR